MTYIPESQSPVEKSVNLSTWAFLVLAKLACENGQIKLELEEAIDKSYRDGLTGIMNHRYLVEKVIPKMSGHIARSKHPESKENRNIFFGIADVDKMKNINDTLGHPMGDEVLKRVSRSLVSSLRPDDEVGRYGGDEFYVVAEISKDIILEPSEFSRLVAVRCQQLLQAHSDFKPEISLAFVRINDHDSPKEAIAEADRLMYELKRKK